MHALANRTRLIPSLISALALVLAIGALLGPRSAPAAASSLVAQVGPAAAQGSGFSYQGSLARGGQPVSGACDLRFSLWDAASGGAQVGAAQTIAAVSFTQGLFTVTVNDAGQFGPGAFSGEARWLAVEAACPRGSAFTGLGRQIITGVPYAAHSGSTAGLQGRPVSAAAPTPGQMLSWDGSAWAPASAYARTLVVSPRATPSESGSALLDAVRAASVSTAEAPYLIKIEPGIYDLGTSTLQMRFYVDIEGSGQGVTILRGQRQTDDVTGLINTQSNAELRQLSIEVTSGGGTHAIGISNNNASPRLTDVTIRTDGATSYGIVNRSGASPRIERVTINATGATVLAAGLAHFDAGAPTLVDSSLRGETTGAGSAAGLYIVGDAAVTVLGGRLEGAGTGDDLDARPVTTIWASGAPTVRVYDARLKAGNVGFRLDGGGTFLFAGSELDLPIVIYFGRGGFPTFRCVGAYRPDFRPLDSNCAPLQ